jgi:protein PsiE
VIDREASDIPPVDPTVAVHAPGHDPAQPSHRSVLAGRAFSLAEHLLLVVIAVMTMLAAATEIVRVVQVQEINLADILLMFLYTEVVGMIGVFYTGKGNAFVYPIFIAITALARLIVLQGKNMAPENIVFEASAILLLALAAAIIVRLGKHA